MSRENLQISRKQDELDSQAREILNEFYKKKFSENDAKLAKALGVVSSNVKRWRETTLVPAWVILFIWQHSPGLLRDRIIERVVAADPCTGLTPDECSLVHDFANMLKARRAAHSLPKPSVP